MALHSEIDVSNSQLDVNHFSAFVCFVSRQVSLYSPSLPPGAGVTTILLVVIFLNGPKFPTEVWMT